MSNKAPPVGRSTWYVIRSMKALRAFYSHFDRDSYSGYVMDSFKDGKLQPPTFYACRAKGHGGSKPANVDEFVEYTGEAAPTLGDIYE